MTEHRRCDGCHYWQRVGTRVKADKPYGDCRLNPPVLDFEGDSVWPTTEDDDWCGHFERTRVE